MYTNYNLKGSVKTIIIATIASFFIFALGSANFTDVKEGYDYVRAYSSKGEDFVIFSDGSISTNYSPNYYQPQVNAVDDPNKRSIKEILYVELTGYSSTVDQTNSQPFITASGYRVRDGVVAANFLEFGTKLRIPAYFGDKVFTVRDRMNSRFSHPKSGSYDGYIDIWFPTRSQAKNFGRVKAKVEILQ